MNIQDWKVKTTAEGAIAQVKNLILGLQQSKVLQKSQSGRIYIQTIGDPLEFATVEILCTQEEIEKVNSAEAAGEVVSVHYKGIDYVGYIQDRPEWSVVIHGRWYTSSIIILVQEKVT